MKEIAKVLLEAKAVVLRPNEPFTFTSGIKSPIYCDNRVLLSDVSARKKIIDAYAKTLKELDFDIVAGVALGSIAWAALAAEKLGKPMVYVRKEAKEHGMKNLIEGKLEAGKRVVIVEDLVSSGKSSLKAVRAVKEAGAIVENCVAIFTYEMEKANEEFEKENCRLLALSNFSELIEEAVKSGYIENKDIELVKEWNKNPEKWGN